jgi:DNA polymerase III epsilon subunit-like protein
LNFFLRHWSVRQRPGRGSVIDEFDTLVNPARDVGPTWIHRITPSMVNGAPLFSDVAGHIAARIHGAVCVGHNLRFDARMIGAEMRRVGVDAARLLVAVASRFGEPGAPARAHPIEARPVRVCTRDGHTNADVPAPYLAQLAAGLHVAPDIALLGTALADLRLTADERTELGAIAAELGLSAQHVQRRTARFSTAWSTRRSPTASSLMMKSINCVERQPSWDWTSTSLRNTLTPSAL